MASRLVSALQAALPGIAPSFTIVDADMARGEPRVRVR